MRSSKAATWLAMVSFSFCASDETRAYKPTRNNFDGSDISVMLLWQCAATILGACFQIPGVGRRQGAPKRRGSQRIRLDHEIAFRAPLRPRRCRSTKALVQSP